MSNNDYDFLVFIEALNNLITLMIYGILSILVLVRKMSFKLSTFVAKN